MEECMDLCTARGGRLATLEQVDTSIASIYVWLLEAMHDIEKFERGRLATLEQMGVSIDFIKVWSPRPRMNLCVVRGG